MGNHSKIIIIGSGPAGCTAAIYAARANLEPKLIAGSTPGGQLTITTDVENYPGFSKVIQGPWLMQEMEEQAKAVGTEFINDHVTKVDLNSRPFKIFCESGAEFLAESLVIATGAEAKWLGLASEKKFQGFGVSGCATCDGFFFKNANVMVVGGGNTAVEEALFLTNFAKRVYLVHRRDSLRAEKLMQKRLFENPKIEVIWNHVVEEILGQEEPKIVNSVRLKNVNDGEEKILDVDGIFIAIGHKPNTSLFKDFLEMDDENYIITASDSTKTSIRGVFAAGDVQDKIFRQAVTSAGTGCMAALEAEKFLAEEV